MGHRLAQQGRQSGTQQERVIGKNTGRMSDIGLAQPGLPGGAFGA